VPPWRVVGQLYFYNSVLIQYKLLFMKVKIISCFSIVLTSCNIAMFMQVSVYKETSSLAQ
jgi:hypothetical protein